MTATWAPADRDAVNHLLAAHHYLGPLRSARLIFAGIVDGQAAGAMVWRTPTSRRLPADGTWLELSRWCLTPALGTNGGSRAHRAVIAMLRRQAPGLTTLVSYSDPSAGHTGALYRACNWLWAPTWLRLRPPPTRNGAWQPGRLQAVKDRWIFPVAQDPRRGELLAVNDSGAIRAWLATAPDTERRWAARSPAADLAAAVR